MSSPKKKSKCEGVLSQIQRKLCTGWKSLERRLPATATQAQHTSELELELAVPSNSQND